MKKHIIACCLIVMLGLCSCGSQKISQSPNALKGLNQINDNTPIIKPANAMFSVKDKLDGSPFSIEVKYPDGLDIPIAIYNVKNFGAKADGVTDDTDAIQSALNAASQKGGGTVYIPEGRYYCHNPINIPSAVTLRGEWLPPDKAAPASKGTVLLTDNGENDINAKSFITVLPTGGLRNLTILYKNQDADSIKQYPSAVKQLGKDSMTLRNVTILGAYIGVEVGPENNELHYLNNVYLSAVYYNVCLDYTTDIGRLENVNISPSYWADNAISNFSDEVKGKIREYFFKNTTGIDIARSDWEYGYNVTIEGCKNGLIIETSDRGAPNAQFSKFNIKDCDIGVNIAECNPIGIAMTDFTITTAKKSTAGVLLSNTFTNVVQFNNLKVEGSFSEQVRQDGKGSASFVYCSFKGWDKDNFAVVLNGGGSSFQSCSFEGGKNQVKASESITALSILGCNFNGDKKTDLPYTKKSAVLIDDTALSLPSPSGIGHKYRKSIPLPKSCEVYNVIDFGAVPGSDADQTEAFQKALDTAGKKGGTVYIPGGKYYIKKNLKVPSGVELRGVFNVPSHSMGGGSVLMATANKGTEDAPAFITLEKNAGVRGFSIYYPGQSFDKPVKYPWAVQSKGENPWAIDVVLINAYNGIDFGTNKSDGHYINYVSGAPIRRGVFLGSNSSNGWVENIQFNPHYWARTSYKNTPQGWDVPKFWDTQIANLDAIIFGYNKSEHCLNNFVYAGKRCLLFELQNGKGTNGTIIGHGSDGGENAMTVEGLDVVEMINTELVAMTSKNYKTHFTAGKDFRGTIGLFNSLMWGPTDDSIVVKGGNVKINQTNFLEVGQKCAKVYGGNTEITSSILYKTKNQFEIFSQDANISVIANMVRSTDRSKLPQGEPLKIMYKGSKAPVAKFNFWS